ncbi:hypothetical protein IAD21_03568 [Abditibacteriota bacterium]|nr:hypothetical protein IAD21_03568 [Abditibacteriota bacterium]
MTERKISPFWALLFGFFLVPLACGVNALIIPQILGPGYGDASLSFRSLVGWVCVGIIFCIVPTLLTFALMCHWNAGNFGTTRFYCWLVTVVALIGWRFLHNLILVSEADSTSLYALLLPFLWTLLFPVAAFCAHTPKARK